MYNIYICEPITRLKKCVPEIPQSLHIIIIICMIILFWKKICYSFCNLDIRMSQNELPKGRIKSETIDSIPRAQHKLP